MRRAFSPFHPLLCRLASSGILLCIALFFAPGCSSQPPVSASDWELSTEAQKTFATLLLDQSMRDSSVSGVLYAGELLLKLDPDSLLLPEAAAWLLFNKENRSACILLEQASEKVPNSLPVHMLLAECRANQNRIVEAIELLEAFLTRRPDAERARQELGILLVRAHRWQDAVSLFNALPAGFHPPVVRLFHARALLQLKQYGEAVRQLKLATKEAPDMVEYQLGLAEALAASRDFPSARAIYDKLIRQYPDSPELRLQLVDLELKNQRFAEALELVQGAPEDQSFTLAAVSLFMDHQRYAEAETLLAPFDTEDAPEEALLSLAVLDFESRNDVDGALARLGEISSLGPNATIGMLLRIHILIAAKRFDEAQSALEEARSQFPEEPQFSLLLVQLLMGREQYDEALAAIDETLRTTPDDVNLLFLRGSILDRKNDKKAAVAVMEHILTIDPDDFRALNYVGFTLADHPEPGLTPAQHKTSIERALKLLQRAVNLAPENAFILDSLAWAQYQAGDLTNAWKNIQTTITMPGGSDEAEIWEHYGDIAARLGHLEEARKGWKNALERNPAMPERLQRKLDAAPQREQK